MKKENKKQNYWYKLDNAAKLYPAIIRKKDSNVYRVGMNLKKDIVPSVLQRAVFDLKPRFPSMYVKLKPGLFWYYFDYNEKTPIIKQETPYINEIIDVSTNNDYYFTIFYFKKRISLEWFHSLCDGFGAMEFLKAIVFHYLELLGEKVDAEGKILTLNQLVNDEEVEDSFNRYHNEEDIEMPKVAKAYLMRDIHFPKYYDVAIINGKVKTDDLLALARKNNATITQYLAAVLTYAVYKAYKKEESFKNKKPINVCVPINLRKFFPSKSLRNFSLFFYTSFYCNKRNIKFEEILEKVKEDFINNIDKRKLQANLNRNVNFERNMLMKVTPLFLKNIAIRIGSNVLGDSLNTMNLSNLGNVDLPESMSKHITSLNFNMAGSYCKINSLGVVSGSGITTISFSRTIYATKIEKLFFNFITNNGLKIEIESNILEEYV